MNSPPAATLERCTSAFSTSFHHSTFGQETIGHNFPKKLLFPNWEICIFDKNC